jgi:DNA-directed RNA polymerase subunit beta
MPETRPLISFSKREGGMPMPHLLDIQTRAFQSLLVPDDVAGARQDVSLERVFRDLFPISDVNGKYELDFKSYALGEPKYSVEECIERDMTYAAPLMATLLLNVFEDVDGQRRLKNQIEREVYLGELTARRAWCSRRRPTPTGSGSSRRGSSPSGGRGSNSPSTSTT